MFKKMICVIAALTLAALPQSSVKAIENESRDSLSKNGQAIYEKHYTVNLKNLNLKVENGKIQVLPKKNILPEKNMIAEIDNNNATLLKNMISDGRFSKDLQQMIKEGHTPIAIGVAETQFLNTLDKDGKVINSRPMTVEEVERYKSTDNVYASISGGTQTHSNLSLYTTVSGSGPDYWVQSNAYWSGGGDRSSGDEKLGMTWDSSFSANNSNSTNVQYGSYKSTASLDDFRQTGGAVWDFVNYKYVGNSPYSLTGAYVGMSVHRDGLYGRHYFTSNYIHTYQSYSLTSATVSYTGSSESKTGYTIALNISAVPSQWTLVSYVEGDF